MLFITDEKKENSANRLARHILIAGDLISKAYAPHVKGILRDDTVLYCGENTCSSFSIAQNIERWIREAGTTPNIVIWSAGLYDCKIPLTNADAYAANLSSIVAKIKSSGVERIAFTTIIRMAPAPTHDDAHIETLNSVSRQLLPALGVDIIDLHRVSLSFGPHAQPTEKESVFLACAIVMGLSL